MLTHFTYFILFFVTLSSVQESAAQDVGSPSRLPVPRFEVDSTANFPVDVPASYRATTGYLIVLEDRERPGGRELRLPVAIVHAQSGIDKTSPVLYLGGGPGSSALNVAAYPGAYPFTADRDFVVLEQRGTRYADPALNCPEYTEALQQSVQAASADAKVIKVAAVEECRARLEAMGIDPAAYSTASNAADVEDLRHVLDVEQWTLYGASYGTRLALAVMRDYPATVRAAVLDSVLPPQARYDDESAANFEAALGLVFRDCKANSSCRTAFPNLRKRFYAALDTALVNPMTVSVQDKEGSVLLTLHAADLAVLVNTSSPQGIAYAPLMLDGIARRDTTMVKAAAAGFLRASSFAWGMRLSVWCGEALPYADRAISDGSGAILGGLESAVVLPEVCAAWDVAVRPRRETLPVESDVPTLLIAGEYDPSTPPAWAKEAARTLSQSRVVVFRGAGHTPMQNWSGDQCAMQVATQFIAAPLSYVHPDAVLPACVAEQAPPEFITNGGEE